MGIRYERDTILNWINEMGKFLRLLVDKWESFDTAQEFTEVASGYNAYFQQDRSFFVETDTEGLFHFADGLEPEQIRPLALLLMYDGLFSEDVNLLKKAKALLEYQSRKTGNFSFEDFGHLATIDAKLN